MRLGRLMIAVLPAALALPVVAGTTAASASTSWAGATASPSPTGSSIAALGLANVGKKACSTNSRHGRGFETSCTGNGGQPEYWCADFARWVWASAGVADTGSLNALAGSFYSYGLEYGTLSSVPAVGDAVVFDYSGGGEAEHVALVTEANANGTIETVSGDWGGQNGNETQFASTSSVYLNDPAYLGQLGSSPDVMGMTIDAFVAPVGATVTPVMGTSELAPNETLASGDSLSSPNGLYSLDMQRNGDLVESAEGRFLWSSGTDDSGAYAVMRADGDLVVKSPTGGVLWSTRTGGHVGASYGLFLADNAVLTIAGPAGTLWTRQPHVGVLSAGDRLLAGQSLVSGNGLYTLTMLRDGALSEETAGQVVWSSESEGHVNAHALMQAGGNLVIYGAGGGAVWSSRSAGHTGTLYAVLENNGTLVIESASGPVWSNQA